jgi:predicted lipoprotein with Yx(FWY)xxD motif
VAPVPPGTSALIVKIGTINGQQVLVNGNGRALYLYTADTTSTSTCTGNCATAWPPMPGPAKAGTGVDPTQLGTSSRSDGTVQTTYFGHPLYTFAGDTKPGVANGEGVGGTFFLVNAQGQQVQ